MDARPIPAGRAQEAAPVNPPKKRPTSQSSGGNDDALTTMIRALLSRCRVSVNLHFDGGDPPAAAGEASPEEGEEVDMGTLGWSPLSPLARRAVRALAEHGPMTCEEIADRLGESPTGKLKYLLADLVDRGILVSRGGYTLSVPEGWGFDDLRKVVLVLLDRLDAEETASQE